MTPLEHLNYNKLHILKCITRCILNTGFTKLPISNSEKYPSQTLKSTHLKLWKVPISNSEKYPYQTLKSTHLKLWKVPISNSEKYPSQTLKSTVFLEDNFEVADQLSFLGNLELYFPSYKIYTGICFWHNLLNVLQSQ